MKQIFTILALLPFVINAQDFHVATTGDDGGTGSSTDPWESIQHAMDYATPGSTVHIHEGIYNEKVYVNVSGTENNYITFQPFEEGEVVIDGTGLSDYAIVEIYNVHHIAIQDIHIRNSEQVDAVGIMIEGACSDIRIEDCDIYNVSFSSNPSDPVTSETNAQPLIVYGTEGDQPITNLEILDNEIYDCRLGRSEALAINGNVDGFVVSENSVHDVTNIGIDIIGHEGTSWDENTDQARNGLITDNEVYNCLSPYATSAGIYVDGGTNLIIERNHVYNNQWGIEIGCENIGKSTSNVIVRNNFVYGNSTAGIHIGGYDYPNGSGKVANTIVSNNTLYGNDTEQDWTGELYLSYNENLIVSNNIFLANNNNGILMSDEYLTVPSTGTEIYNNLWYHPAGEGSIEFAYEGNYYYTLADFASGTGFGTGSMFGDPSLVALGDTPDLHLGEGSIAINSGTNSFGPLGELDIDLELRIAQSTVDIGADEFGSAVNIVDVAISDFKVFPNPTSNYFMIQSANSPINHISIFDLKGKKVKEIQRSFSTNESINVEDLKPGVYTLKMRSIKGEISTKQLIIR